MKQTIHTDAAPKAIGTYSQAIKADNTVYISGQIPLDPKTMQLVEGDFSKRVHQVFENLKAIAKAAGGDFNHIVKLNVSLTDLNNFATLNEIMTTYFTQPFPARAVVQVAALPKGTDVEIEAIMVID